MYDILQGNLEENHEQGYSIRDITGLIPVALTPPHTTEIELVFKEQQPNTYIPVILIGQVLEAAPLSEEEAAALEQGAPVPTPKRYIEVKKLIKLTWDLNINEQWMLEVDKLARDVYPQMATLGAGTTYTAAQQ